MSSIDFSKISDATLEKLANNQEIDFTILPDDELEEVAKYLDTNKKSKAIMSTSTPKVEGPSKTESFIRGAAQGASLGFADEITAKMEELLFDKDYQQALAESRAAYKEAEEVNPATSFVGNLVGGIAVPVPGLGIAKGAAKGGAAVARMATAGAGLGAVAGAGVSEGATAGEIAEDAVAGGLAGGVLTPVIGMGAPALVKKAGELADSTRLGRAVQNIFTKTKDSVVEQADKLAAARAAGASDIDIKKIVDEPIFGSEDFYIKQADRLKADAESFIKDLINPRTDVDKLGVAGFRNSLYNEVSNIAKQENVKVKSQELIEMLKSSGMSGEDFKKAFPQMASEFERVMQETLGITGFKLDKVVNPKVLEKQVKIATDKMESKLLAEKEKISSSMKNEAVKKAQAAIDSLNKDPRAVVNNLADSFVEGQRVKLHTKAVNVANEEARDIVARFTNPMKYVDQASDIPPEVQVQSIKAGAERILRTMLPEEALGDTPVAIEKAFASAKSKSLIDAINDRIKSTTKLTDAVDPDTGRIVFTASLEDPFTGSVISKPISVKSELQPLIDASKAAPKKGSPEYVRSVAALSQDILREMRESVGEATVLRRAVESPEGKMLIGEIVDPLTNKVKQVSQVLPEETAFTTQASPLKEELGVEELNKLKSRYTQMLKNTELSQETRDLLMKAKDFVSQKLSSSPKSKEALTKANEFRKFESEELNRLLSRPIAELNTMAITDRDMYNKIVQNEANQLFRQLVQDSDKLVSPDGVRLNQFEQSLSKAGEMGMSSARQLQSQMTGLKSAAEDVSTLKMMYDREELPGGFAAMLTRLGLSPTGALLQTSRAAGSVAGKVMSSPLVRNPISSKLGKIVNMSQEDLLKLSSTVKNPIVRKYVQAMAQADGPKRKALAFNLAQQPGMREAFKVEGIDFDEEENK
jgi:hypothetical protein